MFMWPAVPDGALPLSKSSRPAPSNIPETRKARPYHGNAPLAENIDMQNLTQNSGARERCQTCHGRRLILAWDDALLGCRLVRCPTCNGSEPPTAAPHREQPPVEAIARKEAA